MRILLALANTSKLVTAHPAAVTLRAVAVWQFSATRYLAAIRMEGHSTAVMVSDSPAFSLDCFRMGNSTTMGFHASQDDKQLTSASRPIQRHRT